MTPLSRRRFLTVTAGAAGGVVAGSLLPPSLQHALASPAPSGGLDAIEHVVILMQENRSFDHYFGTLRGVRGFADPAVTELREGRTAYQQPDSGAVRLPFSAREAAVQAGRPASDIQYINDLDHSWNGGQAARANGWHDRWIATKTASTMAFYDRTDLPFQYELADTFTICDAYHCSVFGPTSPNRNYLWSGKIGFEPGTTRRAVENDGYDEDRHPGYEWTTYAERLEAAGVTWRTYQEWDNYQDNQVELYLRYKTIMRAALAKAGDFTNLTAFYNAVFQATEAERTDLFARLDEGVATLSPDDRSIYDRAMRRVEPHGLAATLRADVESGQLPAVSYLVPSAAESEHPSASSPAASASLTYQILDAIASTPEVWKKTVVILTFDENDGYFDHVPPPVPPLPGTSDVSTEDDWYDGKPIGLGIRVPTTVISPWTVGGYVCSEVFDHTSIIRFLERWTGVEEPNISPWRRIVSGDLTSAFDFSRGRRKPQLTDPGPAPEPIARWRPQPPAEQEMPAQETGTRRARPLPYRPEAALGVDPPTGQLTVSLGNTGSSSAHFAVYPYAGEFDAPQHADVASAQDIVATASGDAYRLAVHGPNGFVRGFAGSLPGTAAALGVSSTQSGQRLEITLTNEGSAQLTVTLNGADGQQREKVRLAAGRTRAVSWRTRDGWYDVNITATEDPTYTRRLAGHLENGRESTSF